MDTVFTGIKLLFQAKTTVANQVLLFIFATRKILDFI